MIAVPADGAGHMQRDLREEREQRGYLVGDDLRGVIMAVVHQRNALVAVHRGIAQRKFGAAYGIAFNADAEHLRLDAWLDLREIIRLGKDLVHGLSVPHSRPKAIRRDVLEAVTRPDVHRAGLAKLVGQILRNSDAGLAVLDPEAARLLVGAGQRQRVAHGMGEEGGVEVGADAVRLAEIHPLFEVLRLKLVTIHPLAVLEYGVARVKVQLLRAGAQLQNHVDIGHQLFGCARSAGVIAGCLDSAGKWLGRVGVKTAHIVALPAVQRYWNRLEPRYCSVGFNAELCVFFSSLVVTHLSASI